MGKKTITAAESAERLGVFTRTIYRDVDVLSASRARVFCTQGMLEDYTVSRATLMNSERKSVVLALQTLKSLESEIDAVLDKLGNPFHNNAKLCIIL